MRRTNQRGIVIGPILFVVAILAVLAAAIAAASGSFNGDTSAISAKAQAAAILEYADSVKMGVDRVIAKGCTDTQISFENPIVSGYTNPNAPSDKSCHVFDVNGGGLRFSTLSASDLEKAGAGGNPYFIFEGGLQVRGLGKSNPPYGVDGVEITASLEIDSKKLCETINTMVGMDGYMYEEWHSGVKFIGSYFFYNLVAYDGAGSWRYGQPLGCFKKDNTNYAGSKPLYAPYFFYTVLLVR